MQTNHKHNKKNKVMTRVVFLILVLFLSSCFQLFEKQQKTLAKIDIDANHSVEANLIQMGATTNDVIQIVYTRGEKSEIIKTYETYNWVELIKLRNDTLLVRLSDSSSVPNYIDTEFIKLEK